MTSRPASARLAFLRLLPVRCSQFTCLAQSGSKEEVPKGSQAPAAKWGGTHDRRRKPQDHRRTASSTKARAAHSAGLSQTTLTVQSGSVAPTRGAWKTLGRRSAQGLRSTLAKQSGPLHWLSCLSLGSTYPSPAVFLGGTASLLLAGWLGASHRPRSSILSTIPASLRSRESRASSKHIRC